MSEKCDPRSGVSAARMWAAWGVHVFTASGTVLCLLALLAAVKNDWQEAFVWLTVATIVDSADGALARWARVKEVLPNFDGALLDNIIDYMGFVFLPAFILHRAELLPASLSLAAASALCVASAYQFCQANAKTTDNYFSGFPSYWNIVVLYLLALHLGQVANLAIIVLLIILVFVPIKYVYPSRTMRFRKVTLALCLPYAAAIVLMVWQLPDPSPYVVWASLLFVAYYFGLSLYLMAVPESA